MKRRALRSIEALISASVSSGLPQTRLLRPSSAYFSDALIPGLQLKSESLTSSRVFPRQDVMPMPVTTTRFRPVTPAAMVTPHRRGAFRSTRVGEKTPREDDGTRATASETRRAMMRAGAFIAAARVKLTNVTPPKFPRFAQVGLSLEPPSQFFPFKTKLRRVVGAGVGSPRLKNGVELVLGSAEPTRRDIEAPTPPWDGEQGENSQFRAISLGTNSIGPPGALQHVSRPVQLGFSSC